MLRPKSQGTILSLNLNEFFFLLLSTCMFTYVVVPVIFLMLEKLQKTTVKSHYIRLSLCPFVCPHEIFRLPIGGFSQNFILNAFRKSVEKLQVSYLTRITGSLHKDLRTFVIISRSVLF
jgi:hypothetical protein